MSAESGIQFPKGDALTVYKSVYCCLSGQLPEIKSRKDGYGAAPYVKLQTKYETDLSNLIINPYLISMNSYGTKIHQAYAGTKHFAGNLINSSFLASPLKTISWGRIDPWNCNREMAAEALKTAITVFSAGVSDLDKLLEGSFEKATLEELRDQLATVSLTLCDAKKTVFFIYRTYDQVPADDETGDVIVSDGIGPEGIKEQYAALSRMIGQDFASVQQKVLAKIAQFDVVVDGSSSDVENEGSSDDEPVAKKVLSPKKDGSSDEGEVILLAFPEIKVVAEEIVMVDVKLVFRDEIQACSWFCRKMRERRDQVDGTGEQAYKNLTTMARVSQTVPKPFLLFAKSLDHVFKDKIARYDFVQQVYGRFTKCLSEKGIELEVSRPDSFKMLLNELCAKGAPRPVYQALFQVLMNKDGTGPCGLRFEPAILNAIMNNGDYFKIFDTDHPL